MTGFPEHVNVDEAYRQARALRARYIRGFFARLFQLKVGSRDSAGALAGAH